MEGYGMAEGIEHGAISIIMQCKVARGSYIVLLILKPRAHIVYSSWVYSIIINCYSIL